MSQVGFGLTLCKHIPMVEGCLARLWLAPLAEQSGTPW